MKPYFLEIHLLRLSCQKDNRPCPEDFLLITCLYCWVFFSQNILSSCFYKHFRIHFRLVGHYGRMSVAAPTTALDYAPKLMQASSFPGRLSLPFRVSLKTSPVCQRSTEGSKSQQGIIFAQINICFFYFFILHSGCETFMDIVIVLDGSNSIYPWYEVQDFLINILQKFHVGPGQIQVSMSRH